MSIFLNSVIIFFMSLAVKEVYNKPRPQFRPPPPAYGLNSLLFNMTTANSSQRQFDGFAWEKSGFFEGDIVLANDNIGRNGVVNRTRRWRNGIVPVFIEYSHFNTSDILTILLAMREYHLKTCIKFRPYKPGDRYWIHIKGDMPGCWGFVGKCKRGQVINLNPSVNCPVQWIVLHEFLHALGFFHQHSAPERDDYIEILWDNIDDKRVIFFNKRTELEVNNFGVGYDYDSILHYSEKAFTKNGKPTIKPRMPGIVFKQQLNLSEKDILKLNRMYKNYCRRNDTTNKNLDNILALWILSFMNN